MIEPNDKVVCKDVSGYGMSHLDLDKEYIVEWIDGPDIKLVGVEYVTKTWRFVKVM